MDEFKEWAKAASESNRILDEAYERRTQYRMELRDRLIELAEMEAKDGHAERYAVLVEVAEYIRRMR